MMQPLVTQPVPFQPVQQQQQQPQQQQQQQQHAQQNAEQKQQESAVPKHLRTTVMLRNIPSNYSSQMLKELLDAMNFSGRYDFLYLPMDFRKGVNIGYAFVNGVDPAAARRIREAFDGFDRWDVQ